MALEITSPALHPKRGTTIDMMFGLLSSGEENVLDDEEKNLASPSKPKSKLVCPETVQVGLKWGNGMRNQK